VANVKQATGFGQGVAVYADSNLARGLLAWLAGQRPISVFRFSGPILQEASSRGSRF
jgi:hypothetical protein